MYDVVISGLDYFKEPEPFGCERKDNLTENIKNAVKVFSIVSFIWAILFITVFVVISAVFGICLVCYCIRGVDHFKIFEKSENKYKEYMKIRANKQLIRLLNPYVIHHLYKYPDGLRIKKVKDRFNQRINKYINNYIKVR